MGGREVNRVSLCHLPPAVRMPQSDSVGHHQLGLDGNMRSLASQKPSLALVFPTFPGLKIALGSRGILTWLMQDALESSFQTNEQTITCDFQEILMQLVIGRRNKKSTRGRNNRPSGGLIIVNAERAKVAPVYVHTARNPQHAIFQTLRLTRKTQGFSTSKILPLTLSGCQKGRN